MELKLYSAESEGFESENTVINNFIAEVFHRTKGKGTFVIDRGGDRIQIIEPLCQLKGKFVIRLKDRYLIDVKSNEKVLLRNHIEQRECLPFGVVLERRTKNGKRVPMRLRYSYKEVKIPALVKAGVKTKLWLVTACSDRAKRPMELLTTIPVSDASSAIAVITNYLSRWSVEEAYRFMKSDSKLEQIQLRTLGKMENMIAACFIAASLVARMARHHSWRVKFEQVTRRQKPAPESLYNWTYRAADAIAHWLRREFSAIRNLNRQRPPGNRKSAPYPGLIPMEFDL